MKSPDMPIGVVNVAARSVRFGPTFARTARCGPRQARASTGLTDDNSSVGDAPQVSASAAKATSPVSGPWPGAEFVEDDSGT